MVSASWQAEFGIVRFQRLGASLFLFINFKRVSWNGKDFLLTQNRVKQYLSRETYCLVYFMVILHLSFRRAISSNRAVILDALNKKLWEHLFPVNSLLSFWGFDSIRTGGGLGVYPKALQGLSCMILLSRWTQSSAIDEIIQLLAALQYFKRWLPFLASLDELARITNIIRWFHSLYLLLFHMIFRIDKWHDTVKRHVNET